MFDQPNLHLRNAPNFTSWIYAFYGVLVCTSVILRGIIFNASENYLILTNVPIGFLVE